MMIIPAVDILGGRAVQLVGGVPGSEKVSLPDPVETAKSWESRGAKALHLVDLDAAMGRGDNEAAIKAVLEALSVPVQVGGGVRSTEKAERLLSLGAARVVVGTRAVTDPEWFSDLAGNHPGQCIMALDVKGGRIQLKGWKESSDRTAADLLKATAGLPLAGVLHTNVDVEGQGRGIDAREVEEFVSICPHDVIASGGVATMRDVELLERAGVRSAVVGLALYQGTIKAEEAWR